MSNELPPLAPPVHCGWNGCKRNAVKWSVAIGDREIESDSLCLPHLSGLADVILAEERA